MANFAPYTENWQWTKTLKQFPKSSFLSLLTVQIWTQKKENSHDLSYSCWELESKVASYYYLEGKESNDASIVGLK